MRDAIREDARLPRARAGDDEERSLGRENGLALGLVEVGEVALRGRDGHRADASRRCGGGLPAHRELDVRGHLRASFPMLTHVMRQVYVPFGSGSYDPLQ